MLGLMLRNLLEALASPAGETVFGERMFVELLKGAVVERVLKMLQGEGVLKDLDV